MRPVLPPLYSLLLALLLSSCGNGNDGRRFQPYKKPGSGPAASQLATGNSPNAQVLRLLPCRSPLVGYDAEFNSLMAGSVLCPGEGQIPGSQAPVVRLKVSSLMLVNARLCIVPFSGDWAEPESCFAINGQVDVQLSTANYSSFVVLPENLLAAYKSFLRDPALQAPARRVLFTM